MAPHPHRPLVILLAVLAVAKIALLGWFGPLHLPDSSGYVGFADRLLAGDLAEDLSQGTVQATLFRIVGYPAVIAAAKLVDPAGWPWLVASVQILLSLAVTAMVFRLGRAFGLGVGWALLGAAAYATSQSLVLDQAMLTDSLYTSVVTLLASALAVRVMSGRGLSAPSALGLGGLLAAAFLLREATTFFTIGIAPLAFLAAMAGRTWSGPAMARAVGLTILLMVPLLATHRAYVEWNHGRVGAAVVTTGGQTNMIFALAKAARHDPTVLDGDSPVEQAARAVFRTYEFHEVGAVNRVLFKDHGMDSVSIQQAAYAAYFSAWRRHPGAMLAVPLEHMRSNQTQLTLRPVESLREMVLWARGSDGGFARWRSVKDGRWWMAPVVVLDGLSKAAATLVFAAFALVTPWRLARRGWAAPEVRAAAGLWLFYFAMLGAYALVHLETRYMAPVVGGSMVVGLMNLLWLAGRFRTATPPR